MFRVCSRENLTLEIETLFHAGHRHEDEVFPVIAPVDSVVESDYPVPEVVGKPRSRHPSSHKAPRPRYDSSGSSDEDSDAPRLLLQPVLLNGADIGDLPTQYSVEGLMEHELPVIGTYVDKRIVPGFRYKVRKLGASTSRFLFRGQALTLQNVGMGYGKRITFEGESLNHNSNYFYSDTHPAGFAFSLVAAEVGNLFTVTDDGDGHPVAEARILHVAAAQKEINTKLDKDGSLVKKVAVRLTCSIDYSGDHHGLMPLYSSQQLHTTGQAIIVKKRGARKAHTTFIEDVELAHCGQVFFKA